MTKLSQHFPRYQQRGKLGHYGEYKNPNNVKVDLINALVDKHNALINTFKTEKENTDFYNAITKEINDVFHETN